MQTGDTSMMALAKPAVWQRGDGPMEEICTLECRVEALTPTQNVLILSGGLCTGEGDLNAWTAGDYQLEGHSTLITRAFILGENHELEVFDLRLGFWSVIDFVAVIDLLDKFTNGEPLSAGTDGDASEAV